jgi:hypothetical protein
MIMTTKSRGITANNFYWLFLMFKDGYDFHVLGNGDIWFSSDYYDGNQAIF